MAQNRRPERLPVYEHSIDTTIMEAVLGESLWQGGEGNVREYFKRYCLFFEKMTYDTVSYETGIRSKFPGSGALKDGRTGVIQNRSDFESYPWQDVARIFWESAEVWFDGLVESLPSGMKIVGGPGNGIFEIVQDIVGYECLCYMQIDDLKLFSDLFHKVGDTMVDIWSTFLDRYAEYFVVCRFGDDLGYKTSTLLAPQIIIDHIVPQYRRVISLIHSAEKPFLLHSCGYIFEVMDELINAGIDAKHSNEDAVAPFDEWVNRYSDRIGLFGGIDVDILCRNKPEYIFEYVLECSQKFRKSACGFALGSGNSIPDYVPVENYLAMVQAVQEFRRQEMSCS